MGTEKARRRSEGGRQIKGRVPGMVVAVLVVAVVEGRVRGRERGRLSDGSTARGERSN